LVTRTPEMGWCGRPGHARAGPGHRGEWRQNGQEETVCSCLMEELQPIELLRARGHPLREKAAIGFPGFYG
jgi:hypothetical protein